MPKNRAISGIFVRVFHTGKILFAAGRISGCVFLFPATLLHKSTYSCGFISVLRHLQRGRQGGMAAEMKGEFGLNKSVSGPEALLVIRKLKEPAK